jgi:hypothetical protein
LPIADQASFKTENSNSFGNLRIAAGFDIVKADLPVRTTG